MINLIIVPFHDYKKWNEEGFRTRDAHLCEHFAKQKEIGRILVVNRPTSLAEMFIKRKSWKSKGEKLEYSHKNTQLSKMQDKTWCLDIFVPDFIKVFYQRKTWWFTSFNYEKVSRAINEACSYLDIEDSILLLQNPMAIGVVNGVKKKKVVFDAIDNWLYHPQMNNKKLIEENYNFVDKNADLIMTVSKALLDVFPTNKNKHWIPNGVDIEYFKAAKKTERDDTITIGYVGKIQDRVDFDLVEECLIRYPTANFVFLGPVYSQKQRVKELKKRYRNINFKGDIHYTKLPEEMHGFDIAIIPHKVDEFTNSMNPLKLYEYLAAGKMVVTTEVAGIESISEYVHCAKDKDSFIDEIEKVLKEINIVTPEDIVNSVPSECIWNNRLRTILDLFDKL